MPRKEGWERLAAAIANHRALREPMSDRALARHAGISPATLDKLLHARADNYRSETLRRLETALGWAPLAVDDVLNGKRPRLDADPPQRELMALWPRLNPQGRRAVVLYARMLLDDADATPPTNS